MHWRHTLDPVFFSLGSLKIRWYGLMYVVGFSLGTVLLKRLVVRGFLQVPKARVDSLVTTLLLSMFLGARLAYIFIYNWDYYSDNLREILFVWQGGLSFHGALVGLLAGGYLFSRRNGISWAQTMDAIALAGTPGLFFGRIGNFINGELYGRRTDAWVGIVFPAGGPFPRHPSQLYEALVEGIVLTAILWYLLKKVERYGIVAASFVVGYGTFRFIVEFFRQPDSQLGYFFSWMTIGQLLCLAMVGGGSLLSLLG